MEILLNSYLEEMDLRPFWAETTEKAKAIF